MKFGLRSWSTIGKLFSRRQLAFVVVVIGLYFLSVSILSVLKGIVSLTEFLLFLSASTILILLGIHVGRHEKYKSAIRVPESDVRNRLDLVTRNTEEIITQDELRSLLAVKKCPKAYWGFEGKSLMHLGMGLVCGGKIKDLIRAGFEVTIFLADVHSWISNKYQGDMKKIRACIEYFEHCFTSLGISPHEVKYLWTSDLAKDPSYWKRVIEVGKNASIRRILRALPIMDRQLGQEDVDAADVSYVCMQVADVFEVGADVACGGLDQRKAHMLARDIADKLNWRKPIALHVPLLLSLDEPRQFGEVYDEDEKISRRIMNKMSKESHGGIIYIHDSPEEIRNKVLNAYCPPKKLEDNPVVEIVRLIIFPERSTFEVKRLDKYGGNVILTSFEEFAELYRNGKIHPMDLKNSVAESLTAMLKGVREYFERNPEPLLTMREVEGQQQAS